MWTPAVRVFDELYEEGFEDGAPTLTSDELIIVWHSTKPGSVGFRNLWMASRSGPDEPFGDIKPLDELNSTEQDMHPSVLPDGLTLYFASNRDDVHPGYNIYKATRASRDEPFGNIQYVEIGTDTYGKYCVHVTSDGKSMYFNSDRAEGTGIWVSHWE